MITLFKIDALNILTNCFCAAELLANLLELRRGDPLHSEPKLKIPFGNWWWGQISLKGQLIL